jgi:hypothetical protein
MYYHPVKHHSVFCTNLQQTCLFKSCTEAVTYLSVFHQQRYTQGIQSHFIKQTSHFAYVSTAYLLPQFSSLHRVISTFHYTSGVPRNFVRGCSTNSVEDRGQKEGGSGGGGPLVRGSTQFSNEWNPYSY